jgi:hypothetical protein
MFARMPPSGKSICSYYGKMWNAVDSALQSSRTKLLLMYLVIMYA